MQSDQRLCHSYVQINLRFCYKYQNPTYWLISNGLADENIIFSITQIYENYASLILRIQESLCLFDYKPGIFFFQNARHNQDLDFRDSLDLITKLPNNDIGSDKKVHVF